MSFALLADKLRDVGCVHGHVMNETGCTLSVRDWPVASANDAVYQEINDGDQTESRTVGLLRQPEG
jgi:hypothetical protein